MLNEATRAVLFRAKRHTKRRLNEAILSEEIAINQTLES